jgi:hypothetical protein
VAACFLSAMGMTGSRHGQGTLTGCIKMTESGITPWIASAFVGARILIFFALDFKLVLKPEV